QLVPQSPPPRKIYFVAQSHTPRNCCVRLVAVVTAGSRNTHYRAARYGLTRTGLAPAGLRQPNCGLRNFRLAWFAKKVLFGWSVGRTGAAIIDHAGGSAISRYHKRIGVRLTNIDHVLHDVIGYYSPETGITNNSSLAIAAHVIILRDYI